MCVCVLGGGGGGGGGCHYRFNLITGLLGFLFLLYSFLVDCVFLGIYSFLLGCPISCHNCSYYCVILVVIVTLVVISPFVYDFSYFSLFLLVNPGKY